MQQQILNAIVSQDTNSVAANWVRAHGDYLFNFATGHVRDKHIAEDLVQETFLAALKSRNNFAGRSSELTWLVGILRHKICDHQRERCRELSIRAYPPPVHDEDEVFDGALAWIHQIVAESISPSRDLEHVEFCEHLKKAMSKLPVRIAQVFQLHSIDEHSNHEVCELLNISEGNLWVMLHRARRQLRLELAAVA